MCRYAIFWVKDAYSPAEATDNSAKEKNAESGRKSFFLTMGQNHPLIVHPDDTCHCHSSLLELGPCRKAPAAAPKRDSTSLGARLVEGGPIKKRIERYRNTKIWTKPTGAAPLPMFHSFPDICCAKAKVHRPTANVI